VKFEQQEDLMSTNPYYRNRISFSDVVVVSSNKVLVCGFGGNTVHLMDSIASREVAAVRMPDEPRSICLINAGMAAVSLNGKKVQFIKIGRDTLTLNHVLEVGKDIYGITTLYNNLVASSIYPPGVEIMTMEGKVVCTIDNTMAGRTLFKRPIYLSNSKDGYVYVSDSENNTVTKLDNRLNVLRNHTDPSLRNIGGILPFSRDQLLVCCQNKTSIVLLNTLTGNTTVLVAQDGLGTPYALAYCHTQRKLFVSSKKFFSTNILTYKIV